MELAKWISFMVLWISASGQDEFPNPDTENYQYHYFVRDENTGDVKSQTEKKIGDTVTGEYRVGEPTGDLRVVTYTADEGGFRANVKYEEGGSPLSDIRDKERQSSPVSGYQFEWLPGNLDDIQAAGKADSSEESSDKSSTTEDGSSSEPTSEATSTQGTPASETTTEGGDSSSSEEGASQKDEPALSGAPSETDSKSDESDSKSDKSESKEESKPESEDESKSDSKTKEESQEAAASAPQSQEALPTESNHVYLPPNLPFYTPPAPNTQDNPTIIYASQNFYNPWQWFPTTARIQREQPPEAPPAHYMTGLGYIISAPNPEK